MKEGTDGDRGKLMGNREGSGTDVNTEHLLGMQKAQMKMPR